MDEYRIFKLNPFPIRGIRGKGFCNQCRSKAWKNLLFESVFQPWCLFDTPKNRVVTSEVFGSFFSESCNASHREPLDTAQIEE